MFYETKNHHNLKYNPFKSCIVPRPIGWISTINNNGKVNIAPYSYFNAVADSPPMVMFATSKKDDSNSKDSITNIELNGEFVVNISNYDLKEEMRLSSTSLPYDVSEAEEFNIEVEPSHYIKVPRIKSSPISLECNYVKTINLDFGDHIVSSEIVIGHVIGIHIADDIIVDGKIDINKLRPIARLGYDQYAIIDHVFSMKSIKN